MTKSAMRSLLGGLLLGAMLATPAPVAAEEVTDVREAVKEIRVQPKTRTMARDADETVAKAIRDGFRRHGTTTPVADRIRVGVDGGVATLTGDLDTWDERVEAGRVAFATEGVWKVENRLTVKGYDYEGEKRDYDAPYYYEEPFPNVG